MFIPLLLNFILLNVWLANADIYLHNPRGSNNRLDEQGRERANDNRMFDSQNNERGGYNVGNLYYYTESLLQIEWTNQHSCMTGNAHCDLILQYMCADTVRDGTTTQIIPADKEQCENSNCNTDYKYGMNEDYDYYKTCKSTSRNKGLFVADQTLKGQSAIYTRQNPGGTRYAYECAEERDYYPSWHRTKWIDIAILTNNIDRCKYYEIQSENVKTRFYCSVPANFAGIIPITQEECVKLKDAQWKESPAHGVPAPVCKEAQFTRDNHLGNTFSGNTPSFLWKLPSKPSDRCVLRIRYNISTNDYEAWQTFQNTQVDIEKKVGLSKEEATKRGFQFKNNPNVKLFSDLDLTLALAIDTSQYSRVFEDRSHVFSIKQRPAELTGQKIHNLNVRGKRGNIVQVYPAVEYDYVPNRLELSKNDHVHIQWTGSNTNPQNNDGQGVAGSDRTNIVPLTYQNISSLNSLENTYDPLGIFGHYTVNYPLNLTVSNLFGFSKSNLIRLATLNNGNVIGGSNDELDQASVYFDLGAQKVTEAGVFHYMCTRNNNFSNRDQKGQIVCYENEFQEEGVGARGGRIVFSNGEVSVPEGAFKDLMVFRVDLKELGDLRNEIKSKSIMSSLNDADLGSKFVQIRVKDVVGLGLVKTKPAKPFKVNIGLKRSAATMETMNVYRINSEYSLMTKVDSSANGNIVSVETDEPSGTYVVRYEKDFTALIVSLVVIGTLSIVIVSAGIFLYKNPKYLDRLKYQSCNFKRSLANQI